jgi:hypothetical protein
MKADEIAHVTAATAKRIACLLKRRDLLSDEGASPLFWTVRGDRDDHSA